MKATEPVPVYQQQRRKLKIIKPATDFSIQGKHLKWALIPAALLLFSAIYFSLKPQPQSAPPSNIVFTVIGNSDSEYSGDQRNSWAALPMRYETSANVNIRTHDRSLVFQNENKTAFTLSPNSEIAIDHGVVELLSGSLSSDLEANSPDEAYSFLTKAFKLRVSEAIFHLNVSPDSHEASVMVLRGALQVHAIHSFDEFNLRAHEKIKSHGHTLQKPEPLSKSEWRQLSDFYQAYESSAQNKAEALGTARQYINDVGSFYSKQVSYASFQIDHQSEESYFKISYDVFIPSATSGFYLKLNDVDLSHFAGMEFDYKAAASDPFPRAIRVEIKQSGKVLRALSLRGVGQEWKRFVFPFHAKYPLAADEIVLIFSHAQVGTIKQGALLIKGIRFVEKDPAHTPQKSADIDELIETLRNLDHIAEKSLATDSVPERE